MVAWASPHETLDYYQYVHAELARLASVNMSVVIARWSKYYL
jgi:hypothetical protein